MLKSDLAKWKQTIKITWINQMAYKLNFVLMIIAPAAIYYLVKYNIWSSIFILNGAAKIQNYTRQEMLNYQAWAMVVSFLGLSYMNSKVSEDIRMGRISAFLLYPFKFWQYHVAGFIGFQLTQFLVSILTIFLLTYFNLVTWVGFYTALQGTIAALLVGLLWFILQFSIALFTFWMEETWVLRVMLIVVSQFLAGALIPVDLYPQWLQSILVYTPFPYLIYVPIKIFMGQYEHGFLMPLAIVSFWIALSFLLVNVIWNRGVKLYTAAGI